MVEKVVRRAKLSQFDEIKENLAYWLSKSPAERVEAVEIMRRMHYGDLPRLQRVVRVVNRKTGEIIKETGKKKGRGGRVA
ncbi:hypothetical protein KKG66_07980 [bacterium]|nr:hypothetical protein [bacterium]